MEAPKRHATIDAGWITPGRSKTGAMWPDSSALHRTVLTGTVCDENEVQTKGGQLMLHRLQANTDCLCMMRQRFAKRIMPFQLALADVNPHGAGAH